MRGEQELIRAEVEKSGLTYWDLKKLLAIEGQPAYGEQADEYDHQAHEVNKAFRIMRPRKQRSQRITLADQGLIWRLHEGLGHMSRTGVSQGVRLGLWKHVPDHITAAMVDDVMGEEACVFCAMHKGRQGPVPQGLGTFIKVIAYRLSMDRKGPYKIMTVYGCKWVIEFIDCATDLVMPVLARSGDGEAIIEAIAWVALYMLQHGHVVKEILTDKGSAEGSDEVVREAARMGIRIQPTAAEAQRGNQVEGHPRRGVEDRSRRPDPGAVWRC
jgi:hypothetical protein